MLDHGQLNLPLSKRGNIDAQVDAYKAQQKTTDAAARKVGAQTRRELKAAAKIDLAALLSADSLIAAKASAIGISRSQLVAHLAQWSKWEPAKLIKARAEWLPVGAQQ